MYVDIDECAPEPCANGATCNNLLARYTCNCAPGWQGYDCDIGLLTFMPFLFYAIIHVV